MNTEAKHAHKNTSILFKKWTVMSLRNRIALYYTIATAFLIALVFAILYFMVESIVYKQFDEEVNNEVAEVFADAHVTSHDFTSFARFKNFIDDKVSEIWFLWIILTGAIGRIWHPYQP